MKEQIGENLVSIIVPVYNGEAYLDRCLESLVSQTYKNIEILLMDDGSNDSTPFKCREWAQRDRRIKTYQHKNMGQGPSRDQGLARSKGEYFVFVDADDTVEPDYIEQLYRAISKEDSDIAICDIDFVWPEEGIKNVRRKKVQGLRLKIDGQYLKEKNQLIDWMSLTIALWDKMFKKTFYQNCNIIQQGRGICEDACLLLEIMLCQSKIVRIPQVLYHYWQNSTSTVHSGGYSRKIIRTIEYLGDIYKNLDLEFADQYAFKYFTARIIGYGEYSDTRQKDGNDNKIIQRFRQLFHPEQEWAGAKSLVFGSFTLRRIVREYQYFMPETYSFSSLISVVSNRSGDIKAYHPNPYRQYALNADIYKVFLERVKDSAVKLIFIDFLEERYGLVESISHDILTKSDALEEAEMTEGKTSWKEIEACSEEYFQLWKEACKQFLEIISPLNTKLIIVQTRLTKKYKESETIQMFEAQEWIDCVNKQCERMENFFRQQAPQAVFIDMIRDEFYTDNEFTYGSYPWHMNDYWYHMMGRSLYQKLESVKLDEGNRGQ